MNVSQKIKLKYTSRNIWSQNGFSKIFSCQNSSSGDCGDHCCLALPSENREIKKNSFISEWQPCILNLLCVFYEWVMTLIDSQDSLRTVQLFKASRFPCVMSKHAVSGIARSICCWTWFDPHEDGAELTDTFSPSSHGKETAFWRYCSSNTSPVGFPALVCFDRAWQSWWEPWRKLNNLSHGTVAA